MKRIALASALIALIAGLIVAVPAQATEGALGRPVTGMQATSYSGLIPPTPGWNWGVGYLYYSGSISGKREIPLIGGGTSLGLDAEFQLLSATGVYIWDTKPGRWNFASMVELPVAYIDVTSKFHIGPFGIQNNQSKTGMYDMTFVPVIASFHISKVQHLSLAVYFYAPTGDYHKGDLANLSLHNWTFSPTVGYTQLFDQGTLEWSTTAAVDIYTKDGATDYQNGDVFRVDTLLIKRLSSGWGFGGVFGWIYQLEKDTGPTADRLNGFKGRSMAIGPTATYLKKWQGGQVEFGARWVHEFDVKNRFEGNPFLLTATISL